MDAMFDIIQRMTPDDGVVFDRTKMDKKSLSAVTWLWDILQRHTRVFTYHIEFFKVEGCACIACAGGFIKPPRLPLEVFRELHPFPLPILGDNSADGKQHYKPFEDMWGSHPVEVLPEDLSKMTDEDTPFKAFFNMPYARQVIVCGECNKPRVLYAKTALTSNEKAVVIRATERSTYLCGGALFPEEDHPLQKRVVVRRAITCAAPVESIYYQKKTAAMPPCCCYCGVKGEDLYIDPALHTINKKGDESVTCRLVECSQPLDELSPVWPGLAHFSRRTVKSFCTHGRAKEAFSIGAIATHVDAPGHFISDGKCIADIDVHHLIAPAVVVDVQERVKRDPDYELTVEDLLAWEATHEAIPEDSIVCMKTGWSSRFCDEQAYCNKDADGMMHFPGFGVDAAKFLINNRKIVGIGIDTFSLDPGRSKTMPVHHTILGAGRYQVENMVLEHLPALGAVLLTCPLRISRAPEAEARVLGLVPKVLTGCPKSKL
ncbi:hypothetical protein CYMTET_33738 [Cymbomonas tetramitiformis]|uniref:Uncharacterized protein n=1 Tax=Cymbomonas tetramitiformis TaxID=36881 RepID=A0AAE0FCC3_9CHLO|nr:hypothetical protein CYMTET_33738 [Cymbomonas tetramitiformis]